MPVYRLGVISLIQSNAMVIFMRKAMISGLLLACLPFCLPSLRMLAQQAAAKQSPTVPNLPAVKPEVLDLVLQDQWDRCIDMFGEKSQIESCTIKPSIVERDSIRHAKAKEFLAQGKIESGQEYYFVALLFQHSGNPDELMLAHVLAITSANKGYPYAKWMAAATMDRYLHTINQPQIFGTQFKMTAGQWTMEPYSREAISDALRAQWCVISLADQEKALKTYQQSGTNTSTTTLDCK